MPRYNMAHSRPSLLQHFCCSSRSRTSVSLLPSRRTLVLSAYLSRERQLERERKKEQENNQRIECERELGDELEREREKKDRIQGNRRRCRTRAGSRRCRPPASSRLRNSILSRAPRDGAKRAASSTAITQHVVGPPTS